MKLTRIAKGIVYVLCVLFLLWIAGSTTEVWWHADHATHTYSTLNAWVVCGFIVVS